ncbi:Serine/threonine-protein phosphatase 4 regulatory subunit 3B [Sciurus carolinensis]|uniref:Serine/threonine-protein phosphatase 4 regulatory subunit 3B n=1 Tax=Sciurus carolinensis TaxID=30640 RepID=A0AA41NC08_SCICA|nr:Serine/threonine-protein phosphatase 4 regulatory subunit 3B [Sciurus carolinensis]
MSDTRRRVKVYTLNEDRQWDDRGTGHVSSTYVEELKGMSLLVRAESDGSLLLESKINPNTAYQKQQARKQYDGVMNNEMMDRVEVVWVARPFAIIKIHESLIYELEKNRDPKYFPESARRFDE